jgi:ribonucleotide monophosphatase NagD (HAD superfamily)
VRWHGKPYRSVYDTCLGLFGGVARDRNHANGDSLRTDIAGAAGAGIDSLLILGGIHADEFGARDGAAVDLDRITPILARGGYAPIAVATRLSW